MLTSRRIIFQSTLLLLLLKGVFSTVRLTCSSHFAVPRHVQVVNKKIFARKLINDGCPSLSWAVGGLRANLVEEILELIKDEDPAEVRNTEYCKKTLNGSGRVLAPPCSGTASVLAVVATPFTRIIDRTKRSER